MFNFRIEFYSSVFEFLTISVSFAFSHPEPQLQVILFYIGLSRSSTSGWVLLDIEWFQNAQPF
jgi:hypothetical protein